MGHKHSKHRQKQLKTKPQQTQQQIIQPQQTSTNSNTESSKLDSNFPINEKTWAVTLFRAAEGGFGPLLQDRHTLILIEGVKDQIIFRDCYDLNVSPVQYTGYIVGAAKGYIQKQTYEKYFLEGKRRVANDGAGRTPIFLLPATHVAVMLEEIQNDMVKGVLFDLTGGIGFISPGNLINRVVGNKHYNCFTWATEKLFYAGIKLSVLDKKITAADDSINAITNTTQHIRYDQYGAPELAFLAKRGSNNAIREFFCKPGKRNNVNDLTKLSEGGPVETYLGEYTPLALAIAYDRTDTVKLLVDELGADIRVKSGRSRDHNALACTQRKWATGGWAQTAVTLFGGGQRPSIEIENYIKNKLEATAATISSIITTSTLVEAESSNFFKQGTNCASFILDMCTTSKGIAVLIVFMAMALVYYQRQEPAPKPDEWPWPFSPSL